MFEGCRQRILEEMISGHERSRAAKRGLIGTVLGLFRANEPPCRRAMVVVLPGGERELHSRMEIDMMLKNGKDNALR